MFEQKELIAINNILRQVQLVYKDSKIINNIIDKIDSLIEKPKDETPQKEVVEGETV